MVLDFNTVAIDIGPILPIYINKINIILDTSFNEGVTPVERPVVENALVTSNNTQSNGTNVLLDVSITEITIEETIIKEIGEVITITTDDVKENIVLDVDTYKQMNAYQKKKVIEEIERQMKEAAKNLDFEEAMSLRDLLFELKAGDKNGK